MSSSVESTPVLQGVLRRVLESEEFVRLSAAVASGARVVSVAGLTSPPARALSLAAVPRETGRRFAVVVAADRDMETWERDLSFWCGALTTSGTREECEPVLLLPASEGDPYAGASPHAETLERRALALWHLAHGRGRFALVSARALVRRTVAPEQIREAGAGRPAGAGGVRGGFWWALLPAGAGGGGPRGGGGRGLLRGGALR